MITRPNAGDSLPVLFLGGPGRTGSTLLAGILGEVGGLVHVGELCFLWQRGLKENRACGCGEPFRDCPFWNRVLKRAFGGLEQAAAAPLGKALWHSTRTRHVPRSLLPDRRAWLRRRLQGTLPELTRLYRAISEVSGADVVVDSSKLPAFGYALELAPQLQVFWLHVVRDPRAVAYSWRRRKFDRGRGGFFVRRGVFYSSLAWLLLNLGTEILSRGGQRESRYRRLRYEDLLADPQRHVAGVLQMLGIEPASLPFTAPRRVLFGVSHTVSGNPGRFRRGAVELRLDREWQDRLDGWRRLATIMICWPGMLRYGYPLRLGGRETVRH